MFQTKRTLKLLSKKATADMVINEKSFLTELFSENPLVYVELNLITLRNFFTSGNFNNNIFQTYLFHTDT